MRRGSFLALGAAPFLLARRTAAADDVDPATSSRRPALRVLLGTGQPATLSPDLFTFNGRSYRGTFQRLDDGRIVNILDLEEYLYGVVPHEMSPRWPAAALAAQAICARTYVLQRSDPRREYDLVPSELDQVYSGVESESPGSTAAVDATTGQVLTFGGGFAQIAYSSCCGGHTEASSDAWGSVPIPYLGGVVCTFCAQSPNYRWTEGIDLAAIATKFSQLLAPIGTLNDLQITARDPSGRVRAFELVADRGTTTVKGSPFRLAIGPRTLRSLLVTSIARDPRAAMVTFDGGGLGHGVGMCQWGSRGMALAGQSPGQILNLYFPGTAVNALGR